MSSKKESAVTVARLNLRKKGHLKKKANSDETVFRRTVRSDHGYPLITFPKFLLKLGMKLNEEVTIEKTERGWEIITKLSKSKVQKKHSKQAKQ